MNEPEGETESFLRDQGPVVLCVDDDPEVLHALSRCLRHEPYRLITVSDPREALALLGKVPVDLVIADQRMPGMSGTELLFEARERSPRTARAILTGYETPSTVRKGLESGADTFLYKPWNDSKLRTWVRRILDRSGASRPPQEFPADGEPEGDRSFDLGGEGG